jgi:predicted ATPase
MMLAYLALAGHPKPPDIVLIEEPENGLHPRRLEEVIDLLRGLTEGRHAERPTQVVLTTHSPYLLDCVDPRKERVLVFHRDDDGACHAQAVNEEGIAVFLDDFGLGEVWSNEGERGLLR